MFIGLKLYKGFDIVENKRNPCYLICFASKVLLTLIRLIMMGNIVAGINIFFLSTVSVSSTLIVVVLVRQFQPNYLIFRKKPPRYGRNT